MSLYVCVDCGGSKTSAVICDASGTILGRALGGPSNFAYLSLAQFTAAITTTLTAALAACPASLNLPTALPLLTTDTNPFAAASFGVSGVDSPAAIALLTPTLSGLLGIPPGPALRIANDTHLLATPLLAHADITHAVAVIGGTGSIAVSFRRRADSAIDELARIGGWGWILGDEGGGFSVGREALRQMLLDFDAASVTGRAPPESALTRRVLERFGVAHVPQILPLVHLPDGPGGISADGGGDGGDGAGAGEAPDVFWQAREKRLSSLSPLVFEAAFDHGDAFALRVLKVCAGSLAQQVAVLLGGGNEDAPRAVRAADSVISFGGSLVGVEKYRALVLDDLKRRGHVFRYVEFIDDAAAVGAMGLAAAARPP
ncbi:hypothetical protein C0993_000181 [Termitomyces sp. T159_Od127]|nr:hypothetical protein C0993_000181 [Termitomyces sp. T159_Od127]